MVYYTIASTMKLSNWLMSTVREEDSCLPPNSPSSVAWGRSNTACFPEALDLPDSDLRARTWIPTVSSLQSSVNLRMPSPGLSSCRQQKSRECPTAIPVLCEMPSSNLHTFHHQESRQQSRALCTPDTAPPYPCGIVNFVCQLDWFMRCPDSWLNVISGCGCEGVSGRV